MTLTITQTYGDMWLLITLQPECDELIHEARNVNYIDEAEYPSSTQIQNKCACQVLP